MMNEEGMDRRHASMVTYGYIRRQARTNFVTSENVGVYVLYRKYWNVLECNVLRGGVVVSSFRHRRRATTYRAQNKGRDS